MCGHWQYPPQVYVDKTIMNVDHITLFKILQNVELSNLISPSMSELSTQSSHASPTKSKLRLLKFSVAFKYFTHVYMNSQYCIYRIVRD